MVTQHSIGQRKALWDAFCQRQQIIANTTPLFDVDNESMVRIKQVGKPGPK